MNTQIIKLCLNSMLNVPGILTKENLHISWEKSAFFTDAEQSKFHVGIRRKNQ